MPISLICMKRALRSKTQIQLNRNSKIFYGKVLDGFLNLKTKEYFLIVYETVHIVNLYFVVGSRLRKIQIDWPSLKKIIKIFLDTEENGIVNFKSNRIKKLNQVEIDLICRKNQQFEIMNF